MSIFFLDKKKIKKFLYWWPLVFYSIAPFIGFLFLSFRYPEFTGRMAFFGWLAVILYVYFLFGRYAEKNSVGLNNVLISGVLIPGILILSQFLKSDFSWENYFSELMILEISSLSIGLFLFFIFYWQRAIKEGMFFIVLLAGGFIGFSCLNLLYPFLLMWRDFNTEKFWPAALTLFGVLAVKIINEFKWFYFFRKKYLASGKVVNFWEVSPILIILMLLLWIAIIPLVNFLVVSFF